MICVEQILISEITQEIYELFYDRISSERKARVDRYRRKEDKMRCVAGEILLRYVLKKTRGLTEFDIEYNSFGKPGIRGINDFYYNQSHSGDKVVIAYGDSEVGIDIEQICMDAGKEKIAKRHFTENEYNYIFGEEIDNAAERFFKVWTAKESYVKYLGTGLRISLDSFDVLEITEPIFHSWICDREYCVTLCSMNKDYTFETVHMEMICGAI